MRSVVASSRRENDAVAISDEDALAQANTLPRRGTQGSPLHARRAPLLLVLSGRVRP